MTIVIIYIEHDPVFCLLRSHMHRAGSLKKLKRRAMWFVTPLIFALVGELFFGSTCGPLCGSTLGHVRTISAELSGCCLSCPSTESMPNDYCSKESDIGCEWTDSSDSILAKSRDEERIKSINRLTIRIEPEEVLPAVHWTAHNAHRLAAVKGPPVYLRLEIFRI
jgi:hypothetical protein